MKPEHVVQRPAALLLMLAVTLLARIPFLGAGFGIDSDAWRVAHAARFIRWTGSFGSSRVPGHPLQEILAAPLIPLGPIGLNGGTAVLSCVAVYFFFRLARRFAVPHPFILSLAFAFVPLVYLQSVNALDYMWAMAFLLAGVEAFLGRRFVLAGVCLGLATGCRITSLAMLLPLVLVAESDQRGMGILRTCLVALGVAALCYVPVIWTYGPGYLRFTHTPYPRGAFIVKEATIDVFGVIGLCGLALVLAAELLSRFRRAAGGPPRGSGWSRLRLLSGLIVACYLILFLRLPDDAGYLLPAVPFVLLTLATLLSPRRVFVLCMFLIASSFLVKVREAGRVGGPTLARFSMPLRPGLVVELPGPIFADHRRRVSEEAFADATLARVQQLSPGSALFVADWYPMLMFKSRSNLIFQYPSEAQLEVLKGRNGSIYYLPDVQRDVQAKTGIDLIAHGGQLLDPFAGTE